MFSESMRMIFMGILYCHGIGFRISFRDLVLFTYFNNYRKNSKYWDIYVRANGVDSDQTALKEQSDQELHCLPLCLRLLEALLHCKIILFYIKDNYGSKSRCPNF